MTDQELLAAYVDRHDEPAFALLVRRHQNLVHSACLRRLGQRALAQDAAQLTFLLLARRARALRGHGSIGGWLYKTALFQASNLMRKERHQQNLQERLTRQPAEPDADSAGLTLEALTPHLDAALLKLRAPDREAVVQRFLADRSLREVAGALGTSEEAARKRVSRALERLAELLRRSGVKTASAAALALLLARTSEAAPAELLDKVTASAHGGALLAQSGGAAASLWLKTGAAAALLLAAGTPALWQWRARQAPRAELDARSAPLQAPATAPLPSGLTASLSAEAGLIPLERPGALSLAWPQPANPLPSLLGALWAMESRESAQARLALWREKLRLNDAQTDAVSGHLRQALRERQDMVGAMAGGEVDFARVMAFLQAGPRAAARIRASLDAEQAPRLDALLLEEARQRAEHLARWRLADLRALLGLSEAQARRAHEELVAHALAFAPARMPAMDGFAELFAWLEARERDEQRRLRPFLSEAQFQLYRAQAAGQDASTLLFSK